MEEKLHQDCYVWFHNTYPELRGLLCYNLNNSRNKIDGARNRAKGLQEGRSDFSYYRKGVAWMIELKTEAGSQSPAQKVWQAKMEGEGFQYVVIRSLSEFQDFIRMVEAHHPELGKVSAI